MEKDRVNFSMKQQMKFIMLILSLAALCVGATELIGCRIADPVLYDEIVAPARNLYHSARLEVKDVSKEYDAWRIEQDEERERFAEEQQVEALARKEERERKREEREHEKEQERRLKKAREIAERARKEREERAAQIASEPAIEEKQEPVDPTVTELVIEDNKEYLTGGNLTLRYFNQGDEIWANEPFGVDPIGSYGCGPTALSMLISSMTGDETVTPATVAAWAAQAGYAALHSGSYLSIVQGVSEHYGLTCSSLCASDIPDAETLLQELSGDGVIVALMGAGHFTASGHFILLHGVTLTGEILVADPNSRDNSLTAWNPALILEELSANRQNGAPLWLVSAPPNEF